MALDPSLNPYESQQVSDTDAQKAESAKKLKSAWTSMIVSVGFSALLLVYVVFRVYYTYSNPALRGNSTGITIIALVVLARVGYSGYRLYNKWNALKGAQEHHRSFS